LRARASHPDIPGTWGFGLWNDPFAADLGFSGGVRRLPALPDAVWFFFASKENYLPLNDDLPASGALAACFRSRRVPALLLALGVPLLPLLWVRPARRLLRAAGRRFIRQDASYLDPDPADSGLWRTGWREYSLTWKPGEAIFVVDGRVVLHSTVAPAGPLGLVIWIDNQYAAIPPAGGLHFGTLPNPEPAWIEIADLAILPDWVKD
jgi:hypothetical protein